MTRLAFIPRGREQYRRRRRTLLKYAGKGGRNCPDCGRLMWSVQWDQKGADAGREATVDHIHPKARGGTNRMDNLRVICRDCNERKGCET